MLPDSSSVPFSLDSHGTHPKIYPVRTESILSSFIRSTLPLAKATCILFQGKNRGLKSRVQVLSPRPPLSISLLQKEGGLWHHKARRGACRTVHSFTCSLVHSLTRSLLTTHIHRVYYSPFASYINTVTLFTTYTQCSLFTIPDIHAYYSSHTKCSLFTIHAHCSLFSIPFIHTYSDTIHYIHSVLTIHYTLGFHYSLYIHTVFPIYYTQCSLFAIPYIHIVFIIHSIHKQCSIFAPFINTVFNNSYISYIECSILATFINSVKCTLH